MAEPAETGSTEEDFRCPVCGTMFSTEGQDAKACPNDGFVCTREKCLVLHASKEDY